MKKLEKILAENMRRFGTKNLREDAKPELQLHIRRVDYDTNISGIVSMYMQGNSSADKSTFEDIVNDITQDIASKNDPTGAYDQTRLVSDIEFDCELKVGNDTIDLTITYDEDGNIQKVEIQDESVAAKHGISDSVIMDYLF
jgi:C-terminal processing protease CtpA/Prc